MITTHNLGFPIFSNSTVSKINNTGTKREQNPSLQAFWKQRTADNEKLESVASLYQKHWQNQGSLDLVSVGDFSFCDQVLNMSYMLGNVAATDDSSAEGAPELAQWFDTDVQYTVPEFNKNTEFKLDASCLIDEVESAKAEGLNVKPVIIGPVTYLWLGKTKDGSNKLELLQDLLACYAELFKELHDAGVEWLQIDEPILALELDKDWKHALLLSYYYLQRSPIKILLATYFGKLEANLNVLCELPVDGVHLDAISAEDEVLKVIDWLPNYKIVSLGVVDARHAEPDDLDSTLQWLKPIHELLGDRLWLAPCCSLLHLPTATDKNSNAVFIETALQKINQVKVLATELNQQDNMLQKTHQSRVAA